MAVRNDQIFELLQAVHSAQGEMKVHLARMNGRLGVVEDVVRELPCTSHSKDITILNERVGSQGTNWNRVINIALAAGQAVLILWFVSKFAF